MPDNNPTNPTDGNLSDGQKKKLEDFIAQRFLNIPSYLSGDTNQRIRIRTYLNDFTFVVTDLEKVKYNIDNDLLSPEQQLMLDVFLNDPQVTQDFIRDYVSTIDIKNTSVDNESVELKGYSLEYIISYYQQYKNLKKAEENQQKDPFNYIQDQIKQMGDNFTPYFEFLDSDKKIRDFLLRNNGKFREDSGPAVVSPFKCRIGGSTFFVPPTSISVHQGFKAGSLTGGVIRQPNSAKMNLGHSETSISLTLYFPNHETIWGFKGTDGKEELDIFNWDPQPILRKDIDQISGQHQSVKNTVPDSVIDFYLSSLRGLITQFKYSPILPIKNEYLNRTFDINAVALLGMTVSTVPDFPFAVVVNLELAKFNYTPFMPMIQDFDQAIHWGKFRQYMGRAAARLDSKVNQGFLVQKTIAPSQNPHEVPADLPTISNNVVTKFEGDLLPRFDKAQDIIDGRNFDFYYPISDPARIFAPDTTDFRQPGEDLVMVKDDWDFILGSLGLNIVDAPQFNFFEFDRAYRSSKYRNEAKVLQQWLRANKLAWNLMHSDKMNEFIDQQVNEGKKSGIIKNNEDESNIRQRLKSEWFFGLYKLVVEDDPSLKLIQTVRTDYAKYTLKEWNVPMDKLEMDWTHCIVQGVSVSLANNFAKLQVQLQDEPTYQHIGGGDSTVQVSMIVIGEDNLIRFRRLFEHISGLARIEKAHGVLGFLGVKNILTSLCGIKYLLPLDFETDTVPNYPHVYSVKMSFIDFDIMQQEREKLSSEQQSELIELFGKRNPFLRLKQSWSAFNAYPDFPLDIRDETGKVLGHLDPDWYFRAFNTNDSDKDIFTWKFDPQIISLIQQISALNELIPKSDLQDERRTIELKDLQKQLQDLIEAGAAVPSYWDIANGKLDRNAIKDPDSVSDMPTPEMTVYLGVYSPDKNEATVLSFFEGGYVAVGTENVKTKKKEYSLGMSYFREDRASQNLKDSKTIDGITGLADYQHEYVDNAGTPNEQYQSIMKDYAYRSIRGRMLRAFPTYMLWLIDEGGRFAGIKLFDNFYGLNSVIDFSVVQSEKPLEDTLVLRLSNIYNKLTTPYRDQIITEDDPLYNTAIGQWIIVSQNRQRNLESGLTDKLIELNNIRLKPGVRIHLRMGYSANPNSLQTVFNGVITEVEPGDIVTVIAQSDAVELSGMVNTVNSKGSSGKLDGGINTGFWLSEPRDLIVRLLTMGSSNFKEWLAWGSKGIFFSDSRFGIRHFGSVLYESMHDKESTGTAKMLGLVGGAMSSTADTSGFTGLLGPIGNYGHDIASIIGSATVGSDLNLNSKMLQIGQMLWINSFAKRDYEIFKRNIYPGNGSGIAQFMGGDQIDAGIAISSAITYYTDSSSQDPKPKLKLLNSSVDNAPTALTKDQLKVLNNATGNNEKAIKEVWDAINESDHVTDQEVLDVMSKANITASDLSISNSGTGSNGLIDSLISPFTSLPNIGISDFLDSYGDKLPDLGGLGDTIKTISNLSVGGAGGIGGFTGLIGGTGRLLQGGNPLGALLGLSSAMPDDDLAGFDEVSFRAQTYMKTVWDLFEVCAALLPNYIVAVRPFEDRSTVFYGKPHWLYTSGVIPITLGVPKDPTLKPLLEKESQAQENLLAQARNSEVTSTQRALTVVDKVAELKDIMGYAVGKDFDPYNVGGDTTLGVNLMSQEELNAIFDYVNRPGDQVNLLAALQLIDPALLLRVPQEELRRLIGNPLLLNGIQSRERDPQKIDGIRRTVEDFINTYIQEHYTDTTKKKSGIDILTGDNGLFAITSGAFAFSSPEAQKAFTDLANNDPVTFAYQFGWKFSSVPVWINPDDGYGMDRIGDIARKVYDDGYSLTNQSLDSKKSLQNANDIWETVRNKGDGIESAAKDAYNIYYPLEELQAKYEDVWELFLRFLWQDPYNRAWVVITADKVRHGSVLDGGTGAVDSVFGDSSNHWTFDRLISAWNQFITATDVQVNSGSNVVTSKITRAWMQSHQQAGNDANTVLGGVVEDVNNWFDKNIGQVLGLITDTITGFIASIRLSLAQLGNALSMTGQFQKQANILNAALNDSIYYQLGESKSDILRLVDNPFTREYGEPVIEIREPFQRLHYASSFDNILSNGIKENLAGVATVVTALSDGKHPVTVHFDKGVSPERQIEKTVETGLLWDNAIGNGLFGFLQPLLHPIEAMRAVSKLATGSSDELSARRVALYHLKESLKSIYDGELLIIGDSDIRPHDLIYIADVYERMYGMVEARQIVHHFTPDTGFVTAITPSALVSVNDPVRYSLLSYAWSKMSNYNIRDDMRAYLGVTTDRAIAGATAGITSQDIYKNFSTQIQGSIQYTHGNTAIIRDIGAMFSGGGIKALTARDEAINQAAEIDMALGLSTAGLTVAGGLIGSVVAPGAGTVVGAVGGWAVGDLIWKGWQWVKDNLLDQHGCYIQYLNKDGQPMDAGLSYYQGVAVGTNHTLKLLPGALGVTGKVNVKEDGHFRITTNDLLGALGWSEVETVSLYRDTSIFVNDINTKILKIAGRDPAQRPNADFVIAKVKLLDLDGQTINGKRYSGGIEDGDTLNVQVIDGGGSYAAGSVIRIRLSVVNAYELQYHDSPYTIQNETDFSLNNDLGKMAYDYLRSKFSNPSSRTLALRIAKSNQMDKYGRSIATVFHNVPMSVPLSERLNTLANYAAQFPPIPFDDYLPDGRPYTLNWEMVMTGYGNVDMRESLWDSSWRNSANTQLQS